MLFDEALEIAIARTGDEQLRQLTVAGSLNPFSVANNRALVRRLAATPEPCGNWQVTREEVDAELIAMGASACCGGSCSAAGATS